MAGVLPVHIPETKIFPSNYTNISFFNKKFPSSICFIYKRQGFLNEWGHNVRAVAITRYVQGGKLHVYAKFRSKNSVLEKTIGFTRSIQKKKKAAPC